MRGEGGICLVLGSAVCPGERRGGICLVLGSAVCPGERRGGHMFSIGFGGMSGGEERGAYV